MINSTSIKQENGAVLRVHPVITPTRVRIMYEVLDDDGQPVFHEMTISESLKVVEATLELGRQLNILELVPEEEDNTATMLDDLLRRKKEGDE